jgi:hypothetical protein
MLALGSVALLVAAADAASTGVGERGRYWVYFGAGMALGAALAAVVVVAIAIRFRGRDLPPGSGLLRTRSARWSAALYGAGIAGLLRLGPPGPRAAVLGVALGVIVVLVLGCPRWMLGASPANTSHDRER